MTALGSMLSGQHLERSLTLDRRKSITFTGKSFYLDLQHNKQTQHLTKTISSLGGAIESFLSRDVNYVVTGNRKAADIANADSSGRKEGSFQRQKISASERLEKTPYSRGKQLLKKVVQTQECSSILSSARSWGVCVLHVDEVLEYLERFTQRQANRLTEGKGPGGTGQTLKVGKLKSPFLKIEDQSRKYRPIHCSFSNFPECSFISSDRSPFETACTNYSTHKDRDLGDQFKEEGDEPQNLEKSGYCECCQITYTKLSEHLVSEQHSIFALNATNYRVIDEIVSHIVCDLIPLPHGFNPKEEQCEASPQCSEGQQLIEDDGLEKEELRKGESKELHMDLNEELLVERHNLSSPGRPPVIQYEACSNENHCLSLSKDPPEQNLVINVAQEPAGVLPEKVLVEDCGPRCPASISNAVVQCDLTLLDSCETTEPSRVGLVTEVSWYTEKAGLTSVYTVQSLVIPPTHVLDQHPELTMDKTSVQPSSFIGALGDPLHVLAQGNFSGSSNEPVQGERNITAHIEPRTNEVVPHEPLSTPSVGVYTKPSPAPTTKSECTLQLYTVSGTHIPLVESACDHHQPMMMANSSVCTSHEACEKLSIDQLSLVPWLPAIQDPVPCAVGNLVNTQDSECGAKRKHCWSPCHPPAKRQPLDCQPMPMWVFHQLPSTMNHPAIPVFSDRMDRDCSKKAAEGSATPPLLCFNPKLAQYEASSESDWDFQLVSQHHSNPVQTINFEELRNAQVNLDESWYGKRLRSVLAHEQTLGSPSTTQAVNLSYDLYLGGVAS